jgi:hypothetical protein
MEETRPVLPRKIGLTFLGMLICWLLNVVHVGVSFWLFVLFGEKFLSAAYTLIGGIGLLQMAYVVPLYRLLRRKNQPEAAMGLVIAACVTALLSAGCDFMAYRNLHFSLAVKQQFHIWFSRKG